MSALQPYSSRFREGTNQVLWSREPDTTAAEARSPADRWFDPVPHKSVGMRENSGPVWSPDGREMAAIVDGYADDVPGGPRRHADRPAAPAVVRASPTRRRGPPIRAACSTRPPTASAWSTLVDGSVRDIAPRLIVDAAPHHGTMTVHAGAAVRWPRDSAAENVDIVIDGARITRGGRRIATTCIAAPSSTPRPAPCCPASSRATRTCRRRSARRWAASGWPSASPPCATRRPTRSRGRRTARRSSRACGSGRGSSPPASRSTAPASTTRAASALDGGAERRRAARRARRLGFDFIKTYVRLPDLLQRRVIDGAHRPGMPVTSHEIYPAVAYGADGVEHIRGTSRRGFSPKISELRRSYQDVIQLLTASGMTLTPTIGIQGGYQLLTLQRRPVDRRPAHAAVPGVGQRRPRGRCVAKPHRRQDLATARSAGRAAGADGRRGRQGRRPGDCRHRLADHPLRPGAADGARALRARRHAARPRPSAAPPRCPPRRWASAPTSARSNPASSPTW